MTDTLDEPASIGAASERTVSPDPRKVAVKLIAASRDAAAERRFEDGSRRRKADIAEEAAPLVEEAGRLDLAIGLRELARKLRATSCWGAGPRSGLSATFREAAELLHAGAEADLGRIRVKATEDAVAAIASIFLGVRPRR